MKIRAAVPVLAALLMTPSIWAQAGAQAPSKVAVISMQTAILSTAEGKEAAAQLQSQFAPRQTELQGLQKQIEDDQNRLRTGQTTLSDDEQARLTNEYNVLTRNFQRKTQDAQDDYTAATQELVNRIGRKMVVIAQRQRRQQQHTAAGALRLYEEVVPFLIARDAENRQRVGGVLHFCVPPPYQGSP